MLEAASCKECATSANRDLNRPPHPSESKRDLPFINVTTPFVSVSSVKSVVSPFPVSGLRQNSLRNGAEHIGQTVVAAGMSEEEALVIEAQ